MKPEFNLYQKKKKYTAGFVYKELKSFLRILANDKSILYQGQLLKKKKYGKEKLAEWLQEYKEVKIIKETHQWIKSILETRAVEYGLLLGNSNNRANSAFFIFFMKNAFGWKDTTTNDHNINLPVPILGNIHEFRAEMKKSKKYIKQAEVYVESVESKKHFSARGLDQKAIYLANNPPTTENSDTSSDRVRDEQEARGS